MKGTRLNREQCNRTKHDSNFSHWKILIGPSDWEDHSKGKEGCARYRIHNLPQQSGPGVYELGIAVSRSGLGREIYKLALHLDGIVAVYLGQADNVRARLQCYGRTGAHLDKGRPLFQEIFSQGFSIVYRWAPMRNKEDALRTEAQLLNTFDYAWNTSNNGTRRPDDILQKLHKIPSGNRTLSGVTRALLPSTQKQVGIGTKSNKLPMSDDESDEAENGSYNFRSRVFIFNRSRPRMVEYIPGIIQKQEIAKICGVALADGSICRKPPVEKRMRCPEHKGMRTNVSTAKAVRASKSQSTVVSKTDVYSGTKDNVEDPLQKVVRSPIDESITNTIRCGIILNDGSTCTRQPIKGRKRCHEHKGMRICASIQTKGNVEDPLQKVVRSPIDDSITNTIRCGIILNDGSTCTRQPIKGRKRCHEHKGMRFCASIQTKGNGYRYRNVSHDAEDPPQTPVWRTVHESITNINICGIILNDGSACRRQPVKGRKRCHEHKGRRI